MRGRATLRGMQPAFTGNGFTFANTRSFGYPSHDYYSNGWKWPKHRLRRFWAWIFAPFLSITRVPAPAVKNRQWWGPDLRLPGMARVGRENLPGDRRFRYGGGGFLGRMNRQVVAVGPDLTRVWYFHFTRPANIVQRWWHKLLYTAFYRWAGETNFSAQDGSVMPTQRWDWLEMLSPTDFGVVQWRKLVVTKHFGGRNANFRGEEAPQDTTE